jgi:hypothetical protein
VSSGIATAAVATPVNATERDANVQASANGPYFIHPFLDYRSVIVVLSSTLLARLVTPVMYKLIPPQAQG